VKQLLNTNKAFVALLFPLLSLHWAYLYFAFPSQPTAPHKVCTHDTTAKATLFGKARCSGHLQVIAKAPKGVKNSIVLYNSKSNTF